MSRRWPVHPTPYPGEALSSWVNRLANALAVPLAVLLRDEFGIPRIATRKYHLDFNPPEHVIVALAEKTGQELSVVRGLTARGYVPSLLDTLDVTPYGVARYTQELSVLLPTGHRPLRHPTVLPWYSLRRFRQPRGCRDCMTDAAEPYLRLHWRFAWTLSCPIHKCILEPVASHVPGVGITEVKWTYTGRLTQVDPSQLQEMDAITLQAIVDGVCHLPWGTVAGGLWIRLLRTVLDELSIGDTHAGPYRQILKERWSSVGLGYGQYLREWRPYERLNQKYQEVFMLMAAKALTGAFEQPAMQHRFMEMAQSYQGTGGKVDHEWAITQMNV
jgi:hypothetical protein